MSDYSQILNCENVDAAVEGFNQHISEAYAKFCPSTAIKCKSNFLYNPSKELLDNIFKKKNIKRLKIEVLLILQEGIESKTL